jgi:hypothetical protein
MSTDTIRKQHETSDVRSVSDAELEQVTGGMYFEDSVRTARELRSNMDMRVWHEAARNG